MILGAEAFEGEDGVVRGYAAQICRWLSGLFGIEFQVKLYDNDALLDGLADGSIDFTGELSAREESRADFITTSPIAERPVQIVRLASSPSFSALQNPRFGFLFNTNYDQVLTSLSGNFQTVPVKNYAEARALLLAGTIDAFLCEKTDPAFSVAGGESAGGSEFVAENFPQLLYSPVSLATRQTELRPVISVIQKALRGDTTHSLPRFYDAGMEDFQRYRLNASLTEEERSYIERHLRTGTAIPVIMDYDDYPHSFYDVMIDKIDGVAPDILAEISKLTGLSFEKINNGHTDFGELKAMLLSGEAAVICNLSRTPEREELFLWPRKSYATERYVLISKSDFPDMSINAAIFARIGYRRGTNFEELVNEWFKDTLNAVAYSGNEELFGALEKGEVDLVMGSENSFLWLTNFKERPYYKMNVVFNRSFETGFGFNKNETLLWSIFNKTESLIDTSAIMDRRKQKTYDYQASGTRSQLYLTLLVSLFLLMGLALIFVFYQRSHRTRRWLEAKVEERMREVKAEQERTREANTRAQIMLDSAPLAASIWDREGRMLDCNREVVYLFGLKDKDDYINHFFDLNPEYQPDGQRTTDKTEQLIKAAFETGYQRFEWMYHTGAGDPLPVETTLVRVPWKDAYQIVAYSRDLREYKALMAEIEAQVTRAEAAVRAKSEFLARMSHEIRTPMNAILGISNLALNNNLPADVYDDLVSIKQESGNLLRIINDILDFSKIESGKMEIIPAEYDLASLINDTVGIIRIRIAEKSLLFPVYVDPHIPHRLFGDMVRIRQILVNLLSNAVKYTKQGSVTLTMSALGNLSAGSDIAILFTVTDTGLGIKSQDMENLFQEFTRLDMKKNAGIVGTGLGLVISENLARQMGGGISVESEYGVGSAFKVTIRQRVADAEPLAVVKAPEQKPCLIYGYRQAYFDVAAKAMADLGVSLDTAMTAAEFEAALVAKTYSFVFIASTWQNEALDTMKRLNVSAEPVIMTDFGDAPVMNIANITVPIHALALANILNGNSRTGVYDTAPAPVVFSVPDVRILVVDDIATNLKVATRFIALFGAQIDTATSGETAIALAEQKAFDLIFMDHMMPEMDGVEAAAKIRALNNGRYQNVPIIALTANAIVGMKEYFLNQGFNDYLAKPIDQTKLSEIMERWIPKDRRLEKSLPEKKKALDIDDAPDTPARRHSRKKLVVEGVDSEVGIRNVGGDEELYRDILLRFAGDIEERLMELTTVPDAGNLPRFTTLVHGLKSAAASVGALDVSQQAAKLEAAGKNGDRETIARNLNGFLLELVTLADSIKKI
jgi:signal transduction histidine kinase/CheY-like chemotaxis protein/HPt (histidine-containing phosphotransfer) domain-containing protein